MNGPSNQELPERITRLEELVAHQEHTIDQLNTVVLEMRTAFEKLVSTNRKQQTQLEWIEQSIGSDHDPNEKPPHY